MGLWVPLKCINVIELYVCQQFVMLLNLLVLVFPIVEEWRSKWFLERRWQKCGSDELIKAMSDINDHVRLAAVSACSKAAELRQIDKQQNKLGNLSMHYFYNL